MMKFIGKPYAGKLHVRIDEGAGKEILISSRSTLLVKFPGAGGADYFNLDLKNSTVLCHASFAAFSLYLSGFVSLLKP